MEKVKLHQLCSMQSGGTPSRGKAEYYNGTIPWSKISDLEKSNDGYIYKTEEYITPEGLKSINNRLFKKGTLLLAMYGSVGKTAIAEIELSTNQAILGINIKDETKLDIKYLRFWFTTIKEKLLNRAVGGTLQNISMGIVKDLEIPLPNLPTQQKIAAILDKADELRQYNKQLIEKYDDLTQSLFLDMFGDPVRNEKGWEVKCLGDMIDFLTSGSRGWAKYYSNEGDVFLRIQNVGYNKLKLDDLTYIQTPETAEAKRTKVQAGDIIISITADLGRTGVIPENFPKAFINQHLAILRLKENFNPNYVSAFIASKGGQALFHKLDKGGVKSGLNFTDLKSYNILCPPLSLQNQFAERVQLIEIQKQQAQEALIKSEDLFQGLLQQAFKGELN